MGNQTDEIQDIIEALQAVRYFRNAYASSTEGLERVGQVLRLLDNKVAQGGGGDQDLRRAVAKAIAQTWNIDLAPRTDPAGRLQT